MKNTSVGYFLVGFISAIAGALLIYFSASDLKIIASFIVTCTGILLIAISTVMRNTEKILKNMENYHG